ncbi:mitochondrial import protein Pam17, partial [Piedraia hortae CBS 480.64]
RQSPSTRFASTAAANHNAEPVTWNTFLTLRRRRRHINLISSACAGIFAIAAAGPVLAEKDFDSWGAQISGLDPMIVLGAGCFGLGAAGWLMGPVVGNTVFKLWAKNKGWSDALRAKEKDFYQRIRTKRADPAASSPQNPIPDYYGEKIGSVGEYRRWLKDQRAFTRKKLKNFV